MEAHHIGYLVKDIGRSVSAFESLGYQKESSVFYDVGRGAQICFLQQGKEGYMVELVAPEKTSALYSLMKRYKNTAYHICYRTTSMEEDIARLEREGWRMFCEPEPAPAIDENAMVAFLMSAGAGMVELVEIKKGKKLGGMEK